MMSQLVLVAVIVAATFVIGDAVPQKYAKDVYELQFNYDNFTQVVEAGGSAEGRAEEGDFLTSRIARRKGNVVQEAFISTDSDKLRKRASFVGAAFSQGGDEGVAAVTGSSVVEYRDRRGKLLEFDYELLKKNGYYPYYGYNAYPVYPKFLRNFAPGYLNSGYSGDRRGGYGGYAGGVRGGAGMGPPRLAGGATQLNIDNSNTNTFPVVSSAYGRPRTLGALPSAYGGSVRTGDSNVRIVDSGRESLTGGVGRGSDKPFGRFYRNYDEFKDASEVDFRTNTRTVTQDYPELPLTSARTAAADQVYNYQPMGRGAYATQGRQMPVAFETGAVTGER
eukprot:TRINITY_DN27875_c0_g1_i4.p1 TRINITY_DN27875_c0_g1~~TRINITY_DN27875_c0_g1_i4.p1  ORF type:complete len:335 (-),score=64.78 TRINITY_DN27875_c0_g1_i4:267-1271(-)